MNRDGNKIKFADDQKEEGGLKTASKDKKKRHSFVSNKKKSVANLAGDEKSDKKSDKRSARKG